MTLGASEAPLWTPDPRLAQRSQMARFLALARTTSGQALASYDDLHRWSVQQPEPFWNLLWQFCEVRASQPADAVLETAGTMADARWFRGARLNYAENLLRYRDRRPNEPALIFRDENGERTVTEHAANWPNRWRRWRPGCAASA